MSVNIPKVFVGTMYCGEGDFAMCCEAVRTQTSVQIEQVIIKDMPELEAHNALWQAWRDVQHTGYDLFIKVDADTVLAHDRVALEIFQMVQANPRITGIQAPLHDYFTDSFIDGLNSFTPKVTFQDGRDKLCCDRNVDVNHDVVVKSASVVQSLRPAGRHCYFATPLQAFHFGLHRTLKGQHDVMARVKAAWQRDHSADFSDNRSYALLGSLMSRSFNKTDGFNYGNAQVHHAFEEASAQRAMLLQ